MRTRVFVFLALLSLALPLLADDQKFSVTMKFNGGKPEALSSFSWGVSNTTSQSGGGGGAGKAVFNDFAFTKTLTQTSNTLFKGCATGEHFPAVVISVADKKGNAFYTITMTDVLVSSYSVSSSGDTPTESVTLNYGKIEFILIGL